jgi:L-lactate dehydrogenase
MVEQVQRGSKVAIIGAGSVGASIAFAIAIKQLCNDLVLIDVNKNKAIGEAMDIDHGLPFLGQMKVRAGEYSDCAGCNVIVIAAGIPRSPGESRFDLARKNVSLARQVVDQIMQYYTGGVILVVSNPVDVVTFMVAKWSGLPEGRVVGTGTVLDSARFRYILSERFNIDVKNIHGYIIGEHGDSQFPAWSATNIAGISVADFCKDVGIIFSEQDKLDIAEKVRVAGADIIKNKGATYYAIAITVNTIVESILHGSGTIRTVGTVMNGLYGLHDVVINLPSILTSNGVRQVLELNLLPEEREKLIYSADQVYTVIHELENI